MNDLTGLILGGKYEIIKWLGAGGFGEVWLAHDNLLEQSVAIKIIRPQLADDKRAHNKFLKEAQTMIKLKHAHIVSIYYLGFDPDEALFYMVMEYAEKGTLADKLNNGPFPIPNYERIFNQICQAVEYAHQKKVIHLDLKPLNILFDGQDNVLVTDFGLARVVEKTSVALSQKMGTIMYMPPEQTWSDNVGGFSDVYALGLILHEILTGQRPARDLLGRELIIHCAESVPDEFKPIIEQATQDNRELRFATVNALAEAFQTSIKAKNLFDNGNIYLNKGEYDQAIANYSEAIRLNPQYAKAYYNRGKSYFSKKAYNQAIQDELEAIRLDPTFDTSGLALTYAFRGNDYANDHKYDEAFADYNEAIRLNPESAYSYYFRGCLYDKLKKYDLALVDITKAIHLNLEEADFYFCRGSIYMACEQRDKAMADFRKVIEYDPKAIKELIKLGIIIHPELKNATAYYQRGNLYYNQGEYDDAIEDYTEAIHLNPDEATFYYNRGLAYYQKNEHDLAIADYTEAIQLNPQDADAYNNRGIIYKNKSDYDRAIVDYTEAIHLKPTEATAYKNRANAYYANGQYNLAVFDYGKAVSLEPKQVISQMGRNLFIPKRFTDRVIVDHLKPIHIAIDNDNEANYESAIADYTETIRFAPNHANTYYQRGLVYKDMRQKDNAIADFRKAVELDNDYTEALTQLRELGVEQ